MLVDKSKISHWLLLFVHQHLYIMHLSMLSPRKGPGGKGGGGGGERGGDFDLF